MAFVPLQHFDALMARVVSLEDRMSGMDTQMRAHNHSSTVVEAKLSDAHRQMAAHSHGRTVIDAKLAEMQTQIGAHSQGRTIIESKLSDFPRKIAALSPSWTNNPRGENGARANVDCTSSQR